MATHTALNRHAVFAPLGYARALIVCSCAIALIAAGRALPF